MLERSTITPDGTTLHFRSCPLCGRSVEAAKLPGVSFWRVIVGRLLGEDLSRASRVPTSAERA
jgi:hypothetical protein